MLLLTDDIIKNALQEDIKSGDITSLATISPDISSNAEFLIKQDGIVAGLVAAEKCFKLYDSELSFTAIKRDGDRVYKGEIAAEVSGKAISILTVERTALNFLQRMSGIATAANTYQEKIKHTKAKIIDTRKTVPGLRLFDKLAVKLGGCANHRIGLYDMFLIKDNHIAVAGSITKAVEACNEYKSRKNLGYRIEVETKNIDEVKEALNIGVDVIMLDNFNISDMKKAVEIINGKCPVEASGGVDYNTVKEIAETGVDFISVGALTHSVKALDISLEIEVKSQK